MLGKRFCGVAGVILLLLNSCELCRCWYPVSCKLLALTSLKRHYNKLLFCQALVVACITIVLRPAQTGAWHCWPEFCNNAMIMGLLGGGVARSP
jgi:hypothetical protein